MRDSGLILNNNRVNAIMTISSKIKQAGQNGGIFDLRTNIINDER